MPSKQQTSLPLAYTPSQDLLMSPPPRTVSFASSSASPVTQPTISSSRKTSVLSDDPNEGLSKGDEGTATTNVIWTDIQEERLALVQVELKQSQKRWSASQEIWLEEEHRLLELKHKHKKALRKEQAAAKRAAGIWKAKTWGINRISSSLKSSRKNSAANANDDIGVVVQQQQQHHQTHNDDDENDNAIQDDENESEDTSTENITETPLKTPSDSHDQLRRTSSLSSAIHRLSSFSVRSSRGRRSAGGETAGTPETVSRVDQPE